MRKKRILKKKKKKKSSKKTTTEEELKTNETDKLEIDKELAEKQKKMKLALEPMPKDIQLRSPIICVLGHVDTGKTSLLDKMRHTNVQKGEAGGITQQIGATYFPPEKLLHEVSILKGRFDVDLHVPGMLIIDTPGHESFSNLRSRGSSLCDMAILVVDIMHGLEKQTLESIKLLRDRGTPFVVALNKVDRIYQWKPTQNGSSWASLEAQEPNQRAEYKQRFQEALTALTQEGFNVCQYWENNDPLDYVSIVPTSAITGEGVSDLLTWIIDYCQKYLRDQIKVKKKFECTVLEVKKIEGIGMTIDVILVNGRLEEGDIIVLSGFQGPVKTTVRALLTPHPMKEMRVKNEYQHHKECRGSMGIKIAANDLESAIAGSSLYKYKTDKQLEEYEKDLKKDIKKIKRKIPLFDEGVCVAASTLGSMEALLVFLKQSKIPVSNISIGTVSKDDIMKAMTILLKNEANANKKKEFCALLAFDVGLLPEAVKYAEEYGVKVISANIIFHLFDQYTAYVKEIRDQRKKEAAMQASFPCRCKTIAFFNKKDPIIMGLKVVEGVLKVGTSLYISSKKLVVGRVESIEKEHKPIPQARSMDGDVAVRIKTAEASTMAGRHFVENDEMTSKLTKETIELLHEFFKDDLTKDDWELVKALRKEQNIPK